MKENKNDYIEEFIFDPEFVNWILKPDEYLDKKWADYIIHFPEKKEDIREAAYILKSIKPIEPEIEPAKLFALRSKIDQKRKTIRVRKLRRSILKYAALFLLLIGVGGIYYILNIESSFTSEIAKLHSSSQGQIILSNGTTEYFDMDNSSIKQLASGNIVLNKDTITQLGSHIRKNSKLLNHIIIPYGKRLDLTLSDGTHVWLNSGSKFSYPTTFGKSSRKVFLTGEAFFDVIKNNHQAFKIYTHGLEIKVLGTSFNVNAYPKNRNVSTVLAEGSVRIREDKFLSERVVIAPGQRVRFNRQHQRFVVDEVDVNLYTSWINGYLLFKTEKVSEVISKLERYYNKKIIVDPKLNKYSFSGKLDLNENFDSIIKKVAFAMSAKVFVENNHLIIRPM